MTDTDTTEADTDTPTADTGGAVEILQLMPPTAWEGMLVLGKIATDPKAYRRALRALHDAAVTTTARQDAREKQLDAREKEFEARIAKETAALEREKKSAAGIWKTAQARERAVERREQAAIDRESSSPAPNYRRENTNFMAGSGFAQTIIEPPAVPDAQAPEPSRTVVRTDPAGNEFPSFTTISRTPAPRVGRRGAA
jgi:hypothetical protein